LHGPAAVTELFVPYVFITFLCEYDLFSQSHQQNLLNPLCWVIPTTEWLA